MIRLDRCTRRKGKADSVHHSHSLRRTAIRDSVHHSHLPGSAAFDSVHHSHFPLAEMRVSLPGSRLTGKSGHSVHHSHFRGAVRRKSPFRLGTSFTFRRFERAEGGTGRVSTLPRFGTSFTIHRPRTASGGSRGDSVHHSHRLGTSFTHRFGTSFTDVRYIIHKIARKCLIRKADSNP